MSGGPATPLIFGILNVTPDSFSDGGEYGDVDLAVARGIELRAQGAHVVDVGGESTRPGAERVGAAEEAARVIPVIRALSAAGIAVSIDTMNAATAAAAVAAGASTINDVSGGLADPEMYGVVAASGARYIAAHWRDAAGAARTHGMDADREARYGDVVVDVRTELAARLGELADAGVDPANIVLDPGLGFAKSAEHNWQLLARLDELVALGHPVLVGTSRKRFLAPFAVEGAPPAARDAATAVTSALAAQAGAWAVRVHDVAATRAALEVWTAWQLGKDRR